jgi:hypothetical protein
MDKGCILDCLPLSSTDSPVTLEKRTHADTVLFTKKHLSSVFMKVALWSSS